MLGASLTPLEKDRLAQTIVAPATAATLSALALIRISGPAAALACDRLFRPGAAFPRPSAMAAYTLAVGKWLNLEGEVLDQVVLAAFRAPRSFTGEDVYEISCHGGVQVVYSIMQSLLELGLSEAGAGEFSKRAFLQGKLDLTQAEAIMDLIAAEGELKQKVAASELAGQSSQALERLSQALYKLQAELELELEFPELLPAGQQSNLGRHLSALEQELAAALASWQQGRILHAGLKVALVGRPNAGKSTLLNLLAQEPRAIVHETPGTTRDVVEAKINLNGLTVVLSDTAGLRETTDCVEREGVRRSRLVIEEADLLLWLIAPAQASSSELRERAEERPAEQLQCLAEPLKESLTMSRPESPEEQTDTLAAELAELSALHWAGKKLIVLAAKSDLPAAAPLYETLRRLLPDCELKRYSQGDSQSLAELKAALFSYYQEQGASQGQALFLHNLRHKRLLEQCSSHLGEARRSLEARIPLEMVASQLWAAQECLGEIAGANVSEQLIDEIFANFCVGK